MKVLAIIYDGFEELEATAPFALLRRANISLTIASNKKKVTGGHQITYSNVSLLKKLNYQDFDALLLPGGPHYQLLEKDPKILEIIAYFMEQNKVTAAICASPTIIGKLGYLKNRNYTCFPPLNQDFNGIYQNQSLVVDDNLITARSAAASIDFAYEIIKKLKGEDALNAILKQIYYEK